MRVLVADDHALFRDGITSLLDPTTMPTCLKPSSSGRWATC
jgi:DNA-binding NarL/FixJ family response regulator